MAKLVGRLLATAALWVRIQTSLKNTKWAIYAKEWPTHSSAKKYTKEESGEERQRKEELNGKKKESKKNGEKEERFLRQKEEGKGREGKEHIS